MFESQKATPVENVPAFTVGPPKPKLLSVTPAMAREYMAWFVNRLAFCRQSENAGRGDKHYYYRPKIKEVEWSAYNRARQLNKGRKPDHDQVQEAYIQLIEEMKLPSPYASLSESEVAKHLSGEQTINLYAINPKTQCCKWLAIDADYEKGYVDLQRLKYELQEDKVEAAVEQSRRGGHLWIFCAEPVPAKTARVFIYHLAMRLAVPIKGYQQQPEGIEIFPRQDILGEGQMGNALRAPLGIHRKVMRRYWFEDGLPTLEGQFEYLRSLKRLTNEELERLTLGLTIPDDFVGLPPVKQYDTTHKTAGGTTRVEAALRAYASTQGRVRKTGRNVFMQCPSCAQAGGDRSRNNLAVRHDDWNTYRCWAGCTSVQIRAALGLPAPKPGDEF